MYKTKIEEVGMIGSKSTQIRVVGLMTEKMHPYTFFSPNTIL